MKKHEKVIRRETEVKRDIDGDYISFLNSKYYFSISFEKSDLLDFDLMNTFDDPYSRTYFRKIANGIKNDNRINDMWECIEITY